MESVVVLVVLPLRVPRVATGDVCCSCRFLRSCFGNDRPDGQCLHTLVGILSVPF